MTIFSLFTPLGGLSFFIYGMNQMSHSLELIAGERMEHYINVLTSNRFLGLVLGCVITIAIQSSSAVTVMLVGLVNSGLMNLSNTVGIIMGSNIGTTITAWIMSLIGVSSDSTFIKMLKPESFSPLLAFIGIILLMISKTSKRKEVGNSLVGFAILMYGMILMSSSVAPLADSPAFSKLLTLFRNPLLGVLTGLVVTAIIQSSAASVGMLQALSLTGGITYEIAFPIIMGQNIGTCATAILSSIGVNRNAKRVAAIHLAFNIIGTVVFMVLFYSLHLLFNFDFITSTINPVGIAMCHSIFNVATTILLFPFTNSLVKIAENVVSDEAQPEIAFIDERLFKTPSIAVAQCEALSIEMATMAKDSVLMAIQDYFNHDEKRGNDIKDIEEKVDIYEDKLGTYLIKLSSNNTSHRDSQRIAKMLHSIGNLERISDHAYELVGSAKEIKEKKLEASDQAREELLSLSSAIDEIINITVQAYANNDSNLARKVEPLEQVIDLLVERSRENHISRLQTGICTLERGFVLADTLNSYERISDHCSNIAVAILEAEDEEFTPHNYLSNVKSDDNTYFQNTFNEYREKYLPNKK